MQDTVIALQDEHEKGNAVGLDVSTGDPTDPTLLGIYDNYLVKKQIIQSAPVIASQLLLVDEVIRAGMNLRKGGPWEFKSFVSLNKSVYALNIWCLMCHRNAFQIYWYFVQEHRSHDKFVSSSADTILCPVICTFPTTQIVGIVIKSSPFIWRTVFWDSSQNVQNHPNSKCDQLHSIVWSDTRSKPWVLLISKLHALHHQMFRYHYGDQANCSRISLSSLRLVRRVLLSLSKNFFSTSQRKDLEARNSNRRSHDGRFPFRQFR